MDLPGTAHGALPARLRRVLSVSCGALGLYCVIPVPVPLDSNSTLLIYGVVPEHYAVVGEALIATLSDALGDAFDAETKEAWVAVYGIVQKTMIGDNYDN